MPAPWKTSTHHQVPRMRFPLVRPTAQFALTILLMWLLYSVFGGRGHLLYMWPITGIQLAVLLTGSQNRRERWQQILAGALGMFLSGVALGNPIWLAIAQPTMHAVELWLLGSVMIKGITCFDDLKKQANVVRFCSAATMVPVCTALLIADPLARMTHHTMFQAWTRVVLSDSLGIAVFTPAILLILSPWLPYSNLRPHNLGAVIPALVLFAGALTLIFTQKNDPLLFLVFPPMIFAVIAIGLEGAVCTSVATSVVACWATAHGQGPVWLIQGATLEHRIFLLQLFLWTSVATALPIGSLLDERREAERLARSSQTIYRTILENSQDMIVLSQLDGGSRFVSPAVEKVTGWTSAEFLALSQWGGIHPDDRELAKNVIHSLKQGKVDHTLRYRALRKDGGSSWVEACIRGFRDAEGGPITGYVATVRDISIQKQTEDSWSAEKAALASENNQLATLAGKDELTGISNRRTFNQVLSVEAKRHARSGDSLALLMIDVDSFKKFNDRYGHHAGDVCLQKVARIFERAVGRVADLAARVGGEEFALLLPGTDEKGAIEIAKAILQAVGDLRIAHEESVTGFVSVSIGICTWLPYQGTDSTQLIQQADSALYESKSSGRNCVTVKSSAEVLAL